MTDVKELLEAGATWRFMSLLFRCPSDAPASSIRTLASELPSEWRPKAREIGSASGCSRLEAAYHGLLGSGGPVSPYESDYQGPGREGLREKGAILGDVAGFYKAFAFDHSQELLETPDHIAVELAFMSYLKIKEAYACMDGDHEAFRICLKAEEDFLNEHLIDWVPLFLDRLVQHSAHDFYSMTAALLPEFLETSLVGKTV
jgi:TorA maturation chaperone TorD